ncbi:MAG TPA: septum formation initiator family protein [Actinomycetota bacterium]|jgi:cell division protein FtsB|nr:septum formation initiator family protein [Actinomycetota bacterium]
MMRASAARKPRVRFGAGPQMVIVTLALGLVVAMAIQPTRQLLEQRQRIEGMAGELAEIEKLNAALERRIDRLKDPDFIEQRARAQIGLIKPGETTFVVMPPTKKQRAAEARARAEEPAPPPEPGALESFLAFVGL